MDVYAMESMPNQLELFDTMDVKIVDISAGKDHAAAVDDQGRLWVWGGKSGFLEPNVVEEMPGGVVGVECGDQVTAAFTEDGAVWTMSHGGAAKNHEGAKGGHGAP